MMMPTLYSFFFSFFDKKDRRKPVRNLFSTWAVGQVTNFGPWRRADNDPALGFASGRIIVRPPPRAEICHLPDSPCRNLRFPTNQLAARTPYKYSSKLQWDSKLSENFIKQVILHRIIYWAILDWHQRRGPSNANKMVNTVLMLSLLLSLTAVNVHSSDPGKYNPF